MALVYGQPLLASKPFSNLRATNALCYICPQIALNSALKLNSRKLWTEKKLLESCEKTAKNSGEYI